VSTVEDLNMRVAATVGQTNEAMVRLRAVGQTFDEALNTLRFTAIGSVHPTLLDAVVKLEQARERLNEAHSLATAALAEADAWRAMA
jgi:cellobiose-specific phosphotransferase system component IIA